jgi:hypothetical protein
VAKFARSQRVLRPGMLLFTVHGHSSAALNNVRSNSCRITKQEEKPRQSPFDGSKSFNGPSRHLPDAEKIVQEVNEM